MTQPAPLTPQINLTQLNAGQNEFVQRYAANGNQDFAPDLKLSWPEFEDVVTTKSGISNVKEIGLTLIHRYNGTNWFLTMACSRLDLITGKILEEGNRFDLTKEGISPSDFKMDFDEAYFNAVTCNGQPINPQQYINNVTIPWYQQVAEMHCQNSLPSNDNTVYIKFSACTYDYSSLKAMCLVPWPHMVLFFMNSDAYGDYVDDAQYPLMFTNRAGDLATMCPPHCNCYDWPSTLPLQNICLP